MSEWRPIPGYPGYQVSDDGQVRGIHPAGRLLKQNWTGHPGPRWRVTLTADKRPRTFGVHALVALAFIGPRPADKPFVRHLNDDPHDNRVMNLAYGTRRDNALDAVRNGINPNTQKEACKRGHSFDETNTYRNRNGQRSCKECRRVAVRASYARRHPDRAGQTHCTDCGQFITATAPHAHGTTRPDGAIR